MRFSIIRPNFSFFNKFVITGRLLFCYWGEFNLIFFYQLKTLIIHQVVNYIVKIYNSACALKRVSLFLPYYSYPTYGKDDW